MKVACIGAGPGGLFLALLLKRTHPEHEVTVFERNPASVTYGFGVVLSDRALGSVRQVDPPTYAAIADHAIHWDDIEVRHRGRTLRCGGHGFSSISRQTLLAVLRRRASELGAALVFNRAATTADLRREVDLLVVAEGAGSPTRGELSARFGTRVRAGGTRFIWLGTTQSFDALTFLFAESEHGPFAVHAYPFRTGVSTFIVEAGLRTWERARRDWAGGRPPAPSAIHASSLDYCARLFADCLGGHPLLANHSRWLRFLTVRNERWFHDNLVLLGDAAHTAHFSVGSGTRMAMDDAIVLSRALEECDDVQEACATYQARRQPRVERLQAAAELSEAWWERLDQHTKMEPQQLAIHVLTRTGQLSRSSLQARDRPFMDEAERWFAGPQRSRSSGPPPHPLATPLRLGHHVLPNRLLLPGAGRAAEGWSALRLRAGVTMVPTPVPALAGDAAVVPPAIGGGPLMTAARPRAGALLGLRTLALGQPPHGIGERALAVACEAVARARRAGASVIVVDLEAPVAEGLAAGCQDTVDELAVTLLETLRQSDPMTILGLRAEIGPDGLLPAKPRQDSVVGLARHLQAEGACDLMVLGASRSEGSPPAEWGASWMKDLLLCERVRNEVGMAVTYARACMDPDDVAPHILAGRIDLYWDSGQM